MRQWWKEFKRRRMYRMVFGERPMDLVFDVGANEGAKSRTFLSLGARVIAIEPQPSCVEKLKEMANTNSRLKVLEMAVTNLEGTALLQLGSHSEISTLSMEMVERYTVPGAITWTESITVRAVTPNALFEQYGVPDLLKLDCEGYDHVIIAGLSRSPAIIEFEFLQHFLKESLGAISHLADLADYEFNFSPFESAKLISAKWRSSDEISSWLRSNANTFIHGNIFARKRLPR